MLRRATMVLLAIGLVLTMAFAHRWIQLREDEEARERAERRSGHGAAEGKPLPAVPSESKQETSQPPAAQDAVVPPVLPDSTRENESASEDKEKQRQQQRQFVIDTLDELMSSMARVAVEDREIDRVVRRIERWTWQTDELKEPKLAKLKDAVWKAVLAMEALELLGCDLLDLIENRYWRSGTEACKLILLAGLGRSRSVTDEKLQSFLRSVAFSSQESELVRCGALGVISGRNLARDFVKELAECVRSTSASDRHLRLRVAELLTAAGDPGRAALRELLQEAVVAGNSDLEQELNSWLTALVDFESSAEDLLAKLEGEGPLSSQERAETIANLKAVLRSYSRSEACTNPSALVGRVVNLYDRTSSPVQRSEILYVFRRLRPSETGLEFLFRVLETAAESKEREIAVGALLDYAWSTELPKEAWNQARVVQAFEKASEPNVRGRLATVMAQVGGSDVLSQMLGLYAKETQPSVRTCIVEGIGGMGKSEIFPSLQGLFEREQDWDVRKSILRAMISVDFDRGIVFMEMAASKEGDEELRKYVEELRQKVR